MLSEASNQKLIERIEKILKKGKISEDISYSIQEKNKIFQCVIKYQSKGKWQSFWISMGVKNEKGNLRKAKKIAEELSELFKNKIKENNNNENTSIINFQEMIELNTTNYNPKKETKADWDFYEYMEYWLNNVIIHSVEQDTFAGYKRIVTGWMQKYFTMDEHKKKVKEIVADDLEGFYDYLRENNLKNATIDHYNDNISSAYKYLLRRKEVRYNPTDLVNPITVEITEVPTYTKSDIAKLFEVLQGDIIELATKFDGYYGLRRSEIMGLRIEAFDFEKNNFIINHVALQNDTKINDEAVYFRDKTKSKKGYRAFPLFDELKELVLARIEQIEKNKMIFGNTYNHKYDGYLFVHDNGNIMQPSFFTRRFKKIIERYNLKKITPHGLRHSIATLLHMEGVDIRDLQDWLGHESITSTNRYTRSDYKKQIETGNIVQKMFELKGENSKLQANV